MVTSSGQGPRKGWQERWVNTVEGIAASLRHAGLGLRALCARHRHPGSVTCVPTVPSALLVRFKAPTRTHRCTEGIPNRCSCSRCLTTPLAAHAPTHESRLAAAQNKSPCEASRRGFVSMSCRAVTWPGLSRSCLVPTCRPRRWACPARRSSRRPGPCTRSGCWSALRAAR